jgi:hypothetical protein
VLLTFYRDGREAEVGRKSSWVEGELMRGLTGLVHSMAREEGGTAACGEEATFGRRRWRRKKEAGRVGWAKRVSGPADCWVDSARSWKKSFQNKNWIFEFTKALEICTRRFRRNFDKDYS